MDGGSVSDLTRGILLSEVVGNGDGLSVGDEPAMEGTSNRGPGSDLSEGTGSIEVDTGTTASGMSHTIMRPVLLVGTPGELSSLFAFLQKTLNGPGIHEFLVVLDDIGHLGVLFGNVDGLDVQALGQGNPVLSGLGLTKGKLGVLSNVQQTLLDEVGHGTGVGTMGHQGSGVGTSVDSALHVQDSLSNHIVGSLGHSQVGVGVTTNPRLIASIQIQSTGLLGMEKKWKKKKATS